MKRPKISTEIKSTRFCSSQLLPQELEGVDRASLGECGAHNVPTDGNVALWGPSNESSTKTPWNFVAFVDYDVEMFISVVDIIPIVLP